jgi:guanylate kinase
MTANESSGHLFIVSAPSGAGKTTLCRALLRRFPDIRYSVSYTTRPPRKGEQEGIDYRFIAEEEFRRGIEQDRWAEWAKVHGYYYGTDAGVLADAIGKGKDVLLDIDVQGACQLVERFPEAVTIFVMPPSIEALRSRLLARGADSREVIDRRMAAAEEEIRCRSRYRHVVVNDRLDRAMGELQALVDGYR